MTFSGNCVRVRAQRLFAGCALVTLTGLGTAGHAQQASWRPERPVEIVVPSTAGSSLDGTARFTQKVWQASRAIDTPIIVVSKPGGGGAIATGYLDQRAGDGHFLLLAQQTVITNYAMGRTKTNYTDYTALATLYAEYMTMVVPPNSRLKSARDFQQLLAKDPQALSIGIGVARGGTNHLTLSLLTKAMGLDVKLMKTVIFQGNSDSLTAVLGGHIDIASMSFAQAKNAAQQGQLRILGIAADKRLGGEFANVPTWKEQGFDVVLLNQRYVLGPKGLTPAQIAYWDGAFQKLTQADEWKAEVKKHDWLDDYAGSKETQQRLAALFPQLRGALVEAGLTK